MKRAILIVAIVALSATLASAFECKKIVITSDPDYPPISWRDPENPDRICKVVLQ